MDGFRGLIHYVGSSYGWLIIWDDKYNPTLLNPFSGAKFALPPTVPRNLVYPSPRKSKELSIWMGIRKAILFSDPSRTEDFLVAMLYGIGRLAFYKHGESSPWTHLTKNSRETRYHGIAYHNDKLYALHELGIDVWDFGYPFPTKVSTIELSRHMTLHKNRSDSKNFRCYRNIVESMGELFFVYLFTFCNSSTSTRGHEIRIYKFNPGENTWEQQENLCGRSLFIANHQIMAVCARDFPECEENSVYFADESDLGLYKLPINGDVMEPLFQQRKSNTYSPPCWIVPNF
ncbi:hypothetical protein FEM48_Zijuj07G0075200 [Ziziphus jujuba var. spinosa]|uniref:KIB1-4 beta-propeller domain-containing protein n=1 Tax=Ziziphus jujuba var. spinosa TaxID=714518 RepID=A0A978V3B2_ZIZJJ|nr:hypothetical protein FEM48_Zijuj07G0075200 [Ziziphus jujuba var. spinosa]